MPQVKNEATEAYPDTSLLVRLMRLQDGDLGETESRQLRAEMDDNPELRAVYADMARGTAAARLAFSSWNVNDNAGAQVLPFRRPVRSRIWPALRLVDLRQVAAAAILGVAIGLLSGHFISRSSVNDDMLRPAGLDMSTASDGDRTDIALQRALIPLLTESGRQQADIDDPAAGLRGTLSVERHLQLASGISCAEIAFKQQQSLQTAITGLACQDPAGNWQVMTMKTGR
ncbi:MAG TPA: hypothetical protein VND94_01500 [Terriglobia bacterium]|nr:hypothetical protein [Terriglobia bacterium]